MSSKISVCEKKPITYVYLLIDQSHFLHLEIRHDLIRKLKGTMLYWRDGDGENPTD